MLTLRSIVGIDYTDDAASASAEGVIDPLRCELRLNVVHTQGACLGLKASIRMDEAARAVRVTDVHVRHSPDGSVLGTAELAELVVAGQANGLPLHRCLSGLLPTLVRRNYGSRWRLCIGDVDVQIPDS